MPARKKKYGTKNIVLGSEKTQSQTEEDARIGSDSKVKQRNKSRVFPSAISFYAPNTMFDEDEDDVSERQYENFFERFAHHDWKDMNNTMLRAMMCPEENGLDSSRRGPDSTCAKRVISEPTTNNRLRWGLVVIICAMFESILLPVQASFTTYVPSLFTTILSRFIDIVFILDVVAGFTTAYVDSTGKVESNPKQVANHYMKGWFILDAIASIPIGWISPEAERGSTALLARLLKLPRAFRVLKFGRLWFERWNRVKLLGKSLQVTVIIVMLVHWTTCIHVSVVGFSEHSTWFSPPRSNANETGFSAKYVVFMYGTVEIILGTGSPTTLEERVFTSILHMVGLVIQAIVLGEVTLIIQKLSAKSTKWKFKMDEINESMKYMALPDRVRQRVRNYFAFSWAVYGGDGGGNRWLGELSDTLHSQVKIAVDKELVEKVPLFIGADSNFVEAVLMKLKTQLYLPGDHVIKYGVVGDCMFFIVRGVLQAMSQDEKIVFSVMNDGHFFGEIALLKNDAMRTATVRATTYAQLNVLFKNDFLDLLLQYPEQADNVLNTAKQRQRNTKTVMSYKVRRQRKTLRSASAQSQNSARKTCHTARSKVELDEKLAIPSLTECEEQDTKEPVLKPEATEASLRVSNAAVPKLHLADKISLEVLDGTSTVHLAATRSKTEFVASSSQVIEKVGEEGGTDHDEARSQSSNSGSSDSEDDNNKEIRQGAMELQRTLNFKKAAMLVRNNVQGSSDLPNTRESLKMFQSQLAEVTRQLMELKDLLPTKNTEEVTDVNSSLRMSEDDSRKSFQSNSFRGMMKRLSRKPVDGD